MKSKGYVIAIDGPDGVGKTTQLQLLVTYLKQRGLPVHSTRHNGGTPLGEELRRVSLSDHPRSAETDLHISLAMGQALSEDIKVRKQHREVIVMDRSPLAVIAYNGYGSQLKDRQTAFTACQQLFNSEAIDWLIYLDAPQAIINKRRQDRSAHDYFESQNEAFHERVRQGYTDGIAFMEKQPGFRGKIIKIDANASIDNVHSQIVKAIQL